MYFNILSIIKKKENLVISGLLVFALTIVSCNSSNSDQQEGNPVEKQEAPPPFIGYSLVKTYPHDTGFFTEGLEFHDGDLLESSGGNEGESPYPSAVGIADLQSGKVSRKIELDKRIYFGEGITVIGNTLFQLTWKSGTGFLYDRKSFRKKGEFKIPSPEGWGLTHDSTHLILSDGSSSLYFLDPASFQIRNMLTVVDHNGPVGNLNELEYVNGFIYANRWQTPYILKINAQTGKITGLLDFTPLVNEIHSKNPQADVLNGIAYHPGTKTFYITGKNWPALYEIRIQE